MPPGLEYRRIAVMGGVYNNWMALDALLEDARRRDVDAIYCLGDMGGFGPHPDRVFPLLREEACGRSRATTTSHSLRDAPIAAAATPTRATITTRS
jgi:hypothetical protein